MGKKLNIRDVVNRCSTFSGKIRKIGSNGVVFKDQYPAYLSKILNEVDPENDVYIFASNYSITIIPSNDIKSAAVTCCDETLHTIMERVIGESLIIDGCFELNNYSQGEKGVGSSYFVIDNHTNISIVSGTQLKNLMPND